MEYNYLTNTPIETIQQCMQESFADYQLDMSYMTIEVMKHRNAICRNDPDFSVGAFDGSKMIGFLNVGIDSFNNEQVAFDGGTGVIKEYRGQGVAGKMFAKSLEVLKQQKIHKFMLEVLQPNKSAIRAYEKEGFSISRALKCYDVAIDDFKGKLNELPGIEIKKISVSELEKYWCFIQHPASWEHMLSGLKAVKNEIIINAAFQKKVCVGFIVYTPYLCWITAIGINPDYKSGETLIGYLIGNLFENIEPSRPKISMNNLNEEDKLNNILIWLGFENPVDQYEMVADM